MTRAATQLGTLATAAHQVAMQVRLAGLGVRACSAGWDGERLADRSAVLVPAGMLLGVQAVVLLRSAGT